MWEQLYDRKEPAWTAANPHSRILLERWAAIHIYRLQLRALLLVQALRYPALWYGNCARAPEIVNSTTNFATSAAQGGIDYLENPMVAAVRELHEETGIRSARIVAAKDEWLHYNSPTCTRSQFTGAWITYKGQTQKW